MITEEEISKALDYLRDEAKLDAKAILNAASPH